VSPVGEPQTHDDGVHVVDNPAELRYELEVDGRLAGILRYRAEPGLVVLVHTDVDPAFEGRGLGGRLVAGALDDVRAPAAVRCTVPCSFSAA
jgi:hypothetical protein